MDYVSKSLLEATLKQLNTQFQDWTEKHDEQVTTLVDRLMAVEQKGSRMPATQHEGAASFMDHVVKADAFKALLAGNGNMARIALPAGALEASMKAAIVNATQNTSQPLVQGQRIPGVVADPLRRQRIRDLMPVGRTGSNLVEYTRENVFTNNAAPQYGSPARENVAKAESGITFTLETAPVITLAHFIPVSKQVLADAPYLQSYVNNRLLQGLKVKEDLQLLLGDGTSGSLNGILKAGNFTAAPGAVSGENRLDRVRRTIAALATDEMNANGILLHPNTWAELEIIKSAGDGEYLLSKPGQTTAPSLWGVPVIPTTAIDEDDFLVGDWAMGAQVWDREEATVQVSFEHSDNFTKNMATILVEERLTITVFRPKAFRKGAF